MKKRVLKTKRKIFKGEKASANGVNLISLRKSCQAITKLAEKIFFKNRIRSSSFETFETEKKLCHHNRYLMKPSKNCSSNFKLDFEVKAPLGNVIYNRVARWYIFKPKIPIWVNFVGSCNGRRLYILWP
jgi:hypothetical protein